MSDAQRVRVLVTAGGTREPIDAVRFIGNRSSGAMGVTIARAAVNAGCEVTLCVARGVEVPDASLRSASAWFESHADLKRLLDQHWPKHDVLVMAAAVSDWTPAPGNVATDRKKSPGIEHDRWTLELQPTEDLVAAAAASKREDQRVIAFALQESADLEQRALEKLQAKRVDAIVANTLETMDARGIDARVFWADGRRAAPGELAKSAFARWLVDAIVQGRA